MAKINKPSTKTKKEPNRFIPKRTWGELREYYDLMTGEGRPGKTPDAFIADVCDDLYEWATKNKGIAVRVNEFCDDYKAPRKFLDKYPSIWPLLNEAKDEAKAILGDRNYRKAVDGSYVWPAVRHTLYQFHKDFKDAEEFHADLKAKEKDAVATKLFGEIFDARTKTGKDKKDA